MFIALRATHRLEQNVQLCTVGLRAFGLCWFNIAVEVLPAATQTHCVHEHTGCQTTFRGRVTERRLMKF